MRHTGIRRSWGDVAAAGGILALVALATFQMATRHPSDWLVGPQRRGNNDLTFGYVALQSVARLSLERFREYPFWNSHASTGGPWCGNPQSGMWYPPNWIFLAGDAGPALGWLMVIHQWWCGLGVYFLCRTWGFSVRSALAGGALCLAASYFIALVCEGQYAQICVMAWTPWALLAYERFRERPWAGLPWVALTLALSICAGHIQEAYYVTLTLTAFALTDAVIRWRRHGFAAAARFLGVWCCAGAITAALAAVELLPTWTYAQQSMRAGRFAISDPTQAGAGLPNLWQLFYSAALGGPESYRGPGQYYWANLCYFGVVPLALAAIGGVMLWRRYPLARYGWLGAVAFGFAFGTGSPVFTFCATVIPGVTLFRGPGRALFLCAVAVSVLAAAGVEALMSPARAASRPRRWLGRALAAGLPILALLELGIHAHAVLRTVPPASVRRGGPIAEFLGPRTQFDRILAQQWLLTDREAQEARLFKANTYEPVALLPYFAAMYALNGQRDPYTLILGFEPFDLGQLYHPIADMLGIRYAVVAETLQEPPPSWKLVRRGQVPEPVTLRGQLPKELPFRIYENPTALPRAYVVGKVRVAPTPADQLRALATIDPRREVVLVQDLLPTGGRADFQPASIVDYRPNQVVIDVTLDRPGYLVLTDTWYPGWEAEDNGQRTAIVQANCVGRAVALPSGRHRVVFRYRCPGLRLGLLVSAMTLALVIVRSVGTWKSC